MVILRHSKVSQNVQPRFIEYKVKSLELSCDVRVCMTSESQVTFLCITPIKFVANSIYSHAWLYSGGKSN